MPVGGHRAALHGGRGLLLVLLFDQLCGVLAQVAFPLIVVSNLEKLLKVLPFLIPVVIFFYIIIRLRFGGCVNFLTLLKTALCYFCCGVPLPQRPEQVLPSGQVPLLPTAPVAPSEASEHRAALDGVLGHGGRPAPAGGAAGSRSANEDLVRTLSAAHRSGRSSIPHEFRCPITKDVMLDPVMAADGHTYERSAIERWLSSGHRTSPVTNAVLTSRNLLPNYAIRSQIIEAAEALREASTIAPASASTAPPPPTIDQ